MKNRTLKEVLIDIDPSVTVFEGLTAQELLVQEESYFKKFQEHLSSNVDNLLAEPSPPVTKVVYDEEAAKEEYIRRLREMLMQKSSQWKKNSF